MTVVVAGCDYPPRPHMVSWFCRAFARLGCKVVRAGATEEVEASGAAAGQLEPRYVAPTLRMGPIRKGRVPQGEFVRATGADLVVMVDCGEDWAVTSDGSSPFAYVWREGNPHEFPRVGGAAGGAPIFCCMLGKGTTWPGQTKFMPFACDRDFLGGPAWEDRPFDFAYTGRERGNTYLFWPTELAARGLKSSLHEYLFPYTAYEQAFRTAKTTAVVDSGRYVGSRGLEAMAMGCVTFWDGGPALDQTGMVAGRDYLTCGRTTYKNGDYMPVVDYDAVRDLCTDRDRWTAMSEAGRSAIAAAHTYEHRAWTIAEAVGLRLPRTVEEITRGAARATRVLRQKPATDPRATVVVTSYNRPQLVRDTIFAVRDQTMPDWQLIVMDDDSNEETRAAIVEAVDGDARIDIVWAGAPVTPQERLAKARYCVRINEAIPRVRGEFVIYSCDDDFLYPDALECLLAGFGAQPDAHVVYGRIRPIPSDSARLWDTLGRPVPGLSFPKIGETDPATGRLVEPATWLPGWFSPTSGRLDHNQFMHRRACFEEMGGPPWWPEPAFFGQPGDAAFLARLDDLGHKAWAVDALVVTKRYHGRNEAKMLTSPERE